MLNWLPAPLIGVITSLLLAVNTLFWCSILYVFVLLRLLIPVHGWRVLMARICIVIAECWIGCNSGWMRLTQKMDWDIRGLEGLKYEGWYLVLSNHQSWVDIFALQHLFNRRIPMLKFFLKQELIWVPVIGLAWWGLDFPFMKRYSPEYLAKHPEMRGKDLETTRKACEKFRHTPVSVMNFVEGTRFTDSKHARQESPYRHLLKPKPGGTAFVLEAMGEYIGTLVNVTIVYPQGRPGFWDFMCGKVQRVVMHVETTPIDATLRSRSFAEDPAYREAFKQWLGELWAQKDARIEQIRIAEGMPATPAREPV